MKRKMIPMLLTAAMIASSLSVPAFAAPFGDTNGHWGQKAIERWSDHGIVKGADGKFRPDDSLTRGELATIVSNLLKLTDMPAGNPFSDLDQNWYTESILKCFEAGIMSGDGATVRPNDPVTREEAMVILSNALRIAPKAGDVTGFDDAHMVSNWAEGAVNALLSSGVVNGVDEDTLAPQGLINRASVVTILNNAIGNYVSEDGTSIEANGGMVLVVGGDVTITGEADSVLILGGDKEVVLEDLEVNGDVIVEGEDTTVVLSGETEAGSVTVAENAAGAVVEVGADATVEEVTVAAPEAEVSVAGNAESVTVTGEETKVEISGTVDVVAVGEDAANTEVKVTEEAKVDTLATEAENTNVLVQGEVSDVKVSETATETNVKVESTGSVETVETKAENVSISGKGDVEKVEASGDNTAVTTPGTEVEAGKGTTGVTAGDNKVEAGETATTTPSTNSSSSSSSSSSSRPSHSHDYTYSTVVENGVEYNVCSCGAKQATGRTVVTDEATLKAALAAGGDVVLGGDIDVAAQIEIPAGVTVTLDLNGKAINGGWNGDSTTNHIYVLSNKGELTITDTSNGENGSINSRGIYNYGELTLEAGAINAIDNNGGYAVNNQDGSTFVMDGGVVAATNEDGDAPVTGNYDATALKVPSGCTATLNGGTITCVSNFTYAIEVRGTLIIPEDSTIEAEGVHGVIIVYSTATIDAGEFAVITDDAGISDHVVYVYGGTVNINGGTFTGDSDYPTGGLCVWVESGSASIAGGSFSGSAGSADVYGNVAITGGTFAKNPSAFVASGYEEVEANGTWTVVSTTPSGEGTEASPYEVATASQMREALAKGGYIELTDDITVADDSEDAMMVVDKDTTIDFGTYTLFLNIPDATNSTANWMGLYVRGGNVTLKGTSGGIKTAVNEAEELYAIVVEGGANLTIEGGNYLAACEAVYVRGEGTVTITGGKFDLTTADKSYMLNCKDTYYNNDTAKIIVKGGEFVGFNPENNASEGASTNFVAEGYAVTEKGSGVWEVTETSNPVSELGVELEQGNDGDENSEQGDGETVE